MIQFSIVLKSQVNIQQQPNRGGNDGYHGYFGIPMNRIVVGATSLTKSPIRFCA